jgi:Mg2+ and Co2+ transporter CorA
MQHQLISLETLLLPGERITPLRGPQLAYYLKKRNPELYQRAKEVKEKYNVTWNEAFAILRGEKRPPAQAVAIDSDIQLTINSVVKRVESLEKRVSELEKLYTNLIATSTKLNTIVDMLSIGLNVRFYFEKYRCIYMDDDGYCKAFYWTAPLKDYKMREVFEEGEKRYYINVKEHMWICALCPKYTSKNLDNLKAKVEALELRLESLENQLAQLQQAIAQQSDRELREASERPKRLLERLKSPGI